MKNSLPHSNAELYLENKSNRIFYKKLLSPGTTLSEILELSNNLANSNFDWSEIQINLPDNEWLHTILLDDGRDALSVIYLYPNPEILFNSGSNPFDNIANDEMSDEVIQERIIRQFPYEIVKRGIEIMTALDAQDLLVAWDGFVDADQNELLVNYYYDGNWWLIFEHRIGQTDKLETMTIENIRDIAEKLSVLTQQIVDAIVSRLTTR